MARTFLACTTTCELPTPCSCAGQVSPPVQRRHEDCFGRHLLHHSASSPRSLSSFNLFLGARGSARSTLRNRPRFVAGDPDPLKIWNPLIPLGRRWSVRSHILAESPTQGSTRLRVTTLGIVAWPNSPRGTHWARLRNAPAPRGASLHCIWPCDFST